MPNAVIDVKNLSKVYPLAGTRKTRPAQGRSQRAQRSLFGRFGSFLRRGGRGSRRAASSFWALRDVSFTVGEGEAVAIIGRNGSGKSTLLKILSQVVDPTHGRVEIFGRVGSLLEVGTGFHPELTGRENVYLNGAVLGMRRAEIDRDFDEIVAFAEVERFLDEPVKNYSSGMYMRLAFAVAAHLRPEILLVDEILAVGDAEFQKRCIAKMKEVIREGRTILFVSHDMASVAQFCTRTVFLKEGQVESIGDTAAMVTSYLTEGSPLSPEREWPGDYNPTGTDACRLIRARVADREGNCRETFNYSEEVIIELVYERLRSDVQLVPNFHVFTSDGACALVTSDHSEAATWPGSAPGVYLARCVIPARLLNDKLYKVLVAISTFRPVTVHYLETDALAFTVVDKGEPGSVRECYDGPMAGAVRPRLLWDIAKR
jgi:lipopolysaccharide transport system ATP-binding protein